MRTIAFATSNDHTHTLTNTHSLTHTHSHTHTHTLTHSQTHTHTHSHTDTHIQEHAKFYLSAEDELQRQIIFESNMKFIENHNENADVFGFTVAMNEFGDLVRNMFPI